MKQLLSLLLCFVFLNAQTFAKHELPGGAGLVSIKGIYGGVLIPISTTTLSTGVATDPKNSLGVFSFTMPDAGFGGGATLMFANGTAYTGSITAMGDPNTGKINAILQATIIIPVITAIFNLDTGASSANSTNVAVNQEFGANGTLKALVENGETPSSKPTLKGKATVDITQGNVDSEGNPIVSQETIYEVSGVQQIPTVTGLQSVSPISL